MSRTHQLSLVRPGLWRWGRCEVVAVGRSLPQWEVRIPYPYGATPYNVGYRARTLEACKRWLRAHADI